MSVMTRDDRDAVRETIFDFAELIASSLVGLAIGVVAIPVVVAASIVDVCYSAADRLREARGR